MDFGSIELPKPEGKPRVFVISGAGTGIPVFRQLQKENTPFCAGIIYKNDMDFAVARHLATECITEKPFGEISEETLRKAEEAMASCDTVINAGVEEGHCNARLMELLRKAGEQGKLCTAEEYFGRGEKE